MPSVGAFSRCQPLVVASLGEDDVSGTGVIRSYGALSAYEDALGRLEIVNPGFQPRKPKRPWACRITRREL